MTTRNKRAIAWMLAGTMTMGLGVTAGATEKISEEGITLTVSGAKPSGLEDWENLACIGEYEERLGIRLDCSGFYETDWDTQKTLLFAGNELPDLIMNAGMTVAEANTYGSQGYLLDFNEYRDIMPNMVATFEANPDLESFLTTEDGHIYGMTQLKTDMTDRLMRTFIKKDWLENLGLEAPTTLDEFYDMLVAFKEQDANGNGDTTDEIPMLWDTYGGCQGAERALLDAFGIYASGWSGYTYILQADEEGQVYLANTSDNYKEFLKFMKKLWDEELIDQEAFIYDGVDPETAKMQEDRYGFFGCGSAPFVVKGTGIETDADWIGICGLESEYNPNRGVSVVSPVVNGISFVASADTEHPEEVAKFVDYFFTEEGINAGSRGYEGQGWEWVEDENLGISYPSAICPEGYASAEEYRYKGSVLNNCLNFCVTNVQRNALFSVPMETLDNEEVITTFGWAALVAKAYRQEGVTAVDTYPIVAYTNEEIETRATLQTDITNYIEQMRAEFITGQTDIEEGWDAYVATVNQMGMDELIEIEQAAYDRYLAVEAE